MKESKFKSILEKVKKSKTFKNALKTIEAQQQTSIKSLAGSLKSIYISCLNQVIEKSIVIVCADSNSSIDILHDLRLLLPEKEIAYLVQNTKQHAKAITQDSHQAWIIEAIEAIKNDKYFITIITPDIFDLEIPSPGSIENNYVKFHKGQNVNFISFTESFLLAGFERKDYVAEVGEISIRGGIVDIYPIGFESPLRFEFWGDEIESIREFDPLSQRSIKEMPQVQLISKVYHDNNKESVSKIEEYFTNETIFIYDNLDNIKLLYENFEINSKNKSIIINSIGKTDVIVKSDPQATVSSSVLTFLKIAIDLHKSGMQMYFCAEGHIHLDRFKDILKNTGRESVLSSETNRLSFEDVNTAFNDINWYHETLSNGFVYNEIMVSLITEHQIFERLRLYDKKSKSTSKGITLRELQELKHGDYVIHEDKGVARFEGFKNVNIGGNETECLRLVFDEEDVLYVNLNYIHKIQKYSASEGIIPKLSKLGTGDWLRKKERTKKKLKDIARDLIKLYAERKTQKGFAFNDDNIWQKEFEASFMYEDTIDQVKTTAEVKKDMESETPMDRLVCGDVGFGKTEIAIRAAFKAVQSGKQVAVLVPTTVLAQQHYMSFKDRISKYPVNVDVISRFRTSAQQHEILEKLSHGQIDILIGTHRILSKDIKFKDLGLLVIDEEQRFGVGAKEKLRQIKVNIDTLTLTATPIPRTLNFSLMGARDLSIIETPPRNRLPVATEIIEFSMEVIAEAITKEVERGGQVFFVSDRIDDLNKIALDLKMTLPTINFAIAHGQMNPKELEKIMEGFVIQKTDVLITTKIVESGLDIPNANTMIINRAQNFGLAELYQLRGRVGRSNSQAYCFLLVPPNQKLSTTSIKRLQAIEEFTDLGSGFQLAMRDLEIRGAGNLLGGEQSGMIHDIGFELYQKILEEAVHELKVNEFSNIFDEVDTAKSTLIKNDDIAIEIGSDAFLPSSYIKSESERFSLYKRLYAVRDRKELDKLIEELVDRYGKLPIQAEELMFVVKLRMAAVATGFERLIVKQKTLLCELPNQNKQEFYAYAYPLLIDIIHDMNNCKISQMSNKIFLEIPLRSREDAISSIWKIKKSMETLDWE